ncbi:DNA topoisomerase 6 subunit A-like [Trifolium medium]|uniref:DNA topoisomerase 6 subunit A-like n=1 Tax=Trifolium medium TaxID=97028 RepID=A0A392MHH3_9FABA|nr:DNA topoisomerase 6 subunit A-like [Trifolium medium]
MKSRRKIKARSSSSAVKTLTQPNIGRRDTASSSSAKAAASLNPLTQMSVSSSTCSQPTQNIFTSKQTTQTTINSEMEAGEMNLSAVNPPTQGDKPYFIADILLPSKTDKRYQEALEKLKPDRDIVTILKTSKTLTKRSKTETRQLPFSRPAPPPPPFSFPTGGGRMAIPQNIGRIEKMTTDGALFILLVSNSYVLIDLAHDLFPQRFPCIVLTAEAPPDFLIRMESELNLPVLALLDADPHSLEMLAFYGRSLKNLKWLGIRPSDIMAVSESSPRVVFPMNKKDIKTANMLLEKDAYVNNRPEWLYELGIMLEKKQKIEIECLTNWGVASYLTEVFLPMKLQQEDWI